MIHAPLRADETFAETQGQTDFFEIEKKQC